VQKSKKSRVFHSDKAIQLVKAYDLVNEAKKLLRTFMHNKLENDFDSIIWENGKSPITKKEFLDGFDKLEAYKNEQNALLEAEIKTKAAAKAALLERLGITEDEAKLLLA